MKNMKHFAVRLMVAFVCISTLGALNLSRKQKIDTLPAKVLKTDSLRKILKEVKSPDSALKEAVETREVLIDTIQQKFENFNNLSRKQDKLIETSNQTTALLKKAAVEKDKLTPIARTYYINTDPRPVVIQLKFPEPCSVQTAPKRHWLFFRKN